MRVAGDKPECEPPFELQLGGGFFLSFSVLVQVYRFGSRFIYQLSLKQNDYIMKNRFYGLLILALATFCYASASPPDLRKDCIDVEFVYQSDILADFQSSYSVSIHNPQGIVSKSVQKSYVGDILDSTRTQVVSYSNYAQRWQENKQHTGSNERISNLKQHEYTTLKEETETAAHSQLRTWRDPGRQAQDVEFATK